jgi:aminomethyltransferase
MSAFPENGILDPEGGEEIPTLPLPLDGWHRAKGGRMVEFAGYFMPIQYEGIMAEHLWVRESAGLFDVSHMGQVHFADAGADRALEAVLPGDITGLRANQIRYSLLLAEDGGILDDLMVTRLPAGSPFDREGEDAELKPWETAPAVPVETAGKPGGLYVVVNGATKFDDVSYLLDVLSDDVTITLMEDQALLALQGPKAVDALSRILPGVEDLVFMTAAAFDWNGTALWISRSGYTGEDGYEISVPADVVEAFADALLAEPEVKPIGLGARDSLRLEAGLPLYGHDLNSGTTPVAADLGFALSKRRREAADFAGAARILAEREAGPKRKRVGLIVDGRQPAREGSDVIDDNGAVIGYLTSGGFSPTLGKPIAMAYVPLALAAPGTRIEIAQRGKVHTATVTAMPFIPHRYVRAGGK